MTPERALEILQEGHPVFLTGPAGSGKTTLLNKFIDWCHQQTLNVAVTASTGIAATHMGGTTIHSWSGIGIKAQMSEWELDALAQKKYLHDRFEGTDVLIIDEISMLDAPRLDLVDAILRTVLDRDEAFGGIQVVLAGDFFQLPPISRQGKAQFAFESQVWARLDPNVCYLSKVFRQDNDPLLDILDGIRNATLTQDLVDLLMERREEEAPDHLTPTKLYTHNVDVDEVNLAELEKLSTPTERYVMTSSGKKNHVTTLKKYCLAPEELFLKEGAQVMFVKNNFPKKIVNGTLGTVIDFDFGHPFVETAEGVRIEVEEETWNLENDGVSLAKIHQLPLRLAWAITVHKSQGMTLDSVEVDLSKSFAPGMGYVALSRVRSLDGLYLRGINKTAFSVEPIVREYDEVFRNLSAELE